MPVHYLTDITTRTIKRKIKKLCWIINLKGLGLLEPRETPEESDDRRVKRIAKESDRMWASIKQEWEK
jgi:hypothetical protein